MIPRNREMRFESANLCNYKCIICPREKLTRELKTMSLTTFRFLLDKIQDETDQYKVCTFSGFGEPLLDPTIVEKVKYAKKKKLDVLMLTNASLLSLDKFKEFDELGMTSIRVSFYGHSPSVYNKIHNIRRKDLFNKIKKTLTEICRIKKNTELILTYNVQEDVNKDGLKSWIEYWEGRADLLEVWRPHNWVNGREYRKVQKRKNKTCGRPWKTPLQVQVDGTVNMCCFDFDGKLTLEDLKSKTLEEIFSSPIFKKIEEHHTSGNFEGSGLICEHCDQRNTDKSGVMLYNSKFDIDERVKMVSTTYTKVI